MATAPARKASILIVDDTVANLQLMATMLKERGYEPRPVSSGRFALQVVENDPPDLILLDINMPGMNGYEVCAQLKSMPAAKDIPVIFISALDEAMDKVRAFKVGGSDYVTKPFQYEEVFARLECQLALRRTRLELERSYANLRELEQLRDDLVHMIVHDMRTPLSVVLASGFVLQQSIGTTIAEEHRADIDALLETGERLCSMTNTVLDVSRLESGKMPLELVDCDLSGLIRSVTEQLAPLCSDRALRLELGDEVRIRCDAKLIARVIENLLSNGLKHTPAGSPLRISLVQADDGVCVSIYDRGPGVPADQRRRIFEKFGAQRTPHSRGRHSAGLGLALCKLVVAAHGGEIGVDTGDETAPAGNQGSRFWFTLPRRP